MALTGARPTYELRIYNYAGDVVRRIARIHDLKCSRIYNNIGVFSCALVGADAEWAKTYFQPPNQVNFIVEVYRVFPRLTPSSVKLGDYFLRQFNPWYDEQGLFYYHIGGTSLEALLKQRLLIPEEDLRYVNLEAEHITEAGKTSNVIGKLVEHHLGSMAKSYRRVDNLTVVYYGEVGDGGGRWDFDNLFDVVQDLAASDEVDFRMMYNRENNMIEFHVGAIYRDRRKDYAIRSQQFILTERFGNLFQPSLKFDHQDEQNALYIRQDAEDEADKRLILRLTSDTENIPYNRVEFEDNNTRKDDTETNLALLTHGKTLLKESGPKVDLEINPENNLLQLHEDWQLGDQFTVEFAGTTFNYRLAELEYTVSAGRETIREKIVKLNTSEYRRDLFFTDAETDDDTTNLLTRYGELLTRFDEHIERDYA